MLTTGVPTLSAIRAWDVGHLTEAADHWTATADRWENVFVQVWQQSRALPWEGAAADALHERTYTDKTTVVSKADQLREAATIARRGAGDISAAQRRVMYAVEDAHNAGFTVGEDLSVTDTRTSRNAAEQAARQSQAQVLAADIRGRAARLVGLDHEVGGNIVSAAGDVGGTSFSEKPIDKPKNNGKIQLAGFGAKQDPPPPSPPEPAPRVIKRPPRTGPSPVQVITAAPPDAQSGGVPTCGGDKILKHLLEVLAGGSLAAVSGAAEAPTLGVSTAGLLGSASLLYNGIDGLLNCD